MSLFQQVLLMLCLVAISAFFSLSEISIAASRKTRLTVLVDEGHRGTGTAAGAWMARRDRRERTRREGRQQSE